MEVDSYIAGELERARLREAERLRRRVVLRGRAHRIGHAVAARYPAARLYLYGSVSAGADAIRFRRESDLDVGVEGLTRAEHWAAWALAEPLAADARLDFVRVEDAPAWLAVEIRARGERLG